VCHPGTPCYKLGIRLGRADVVSRFLESGRPGFYLAVVREGEVCAGDEIELLERHPEELTVAAVTALRYTESPDRSELERAAAHPLLSAGWREHFAARLRR
jgi:MOSC domain-containing protein YiiM